MKQCVLLSLLLALGCVHVHGAPVGQDGLEQGSCEDAAAVSAAELALTKLNQDRQQGYIFKLHRLSNVHTARHRVNGVVFYLTLDVEETNCSVLSRKDWKTCEARPVHNTPVYGQCKAVIYVNKVHRVVRLYKYNCLVRPVPAARVHELCPDCPGLMALDNPEIQKTVSISLEKFNKESGLANHFALLNITRATSGFAMHMYYHAEYTIQETTCPKTKEVTADDKCPPMDCEFAHKGFCKASHYHTPSGESKFTVECEIYEPEAAEREKKLHLLGGETDHSHTDTHTHAADPTHTHDHVHDHTKSHSHHHRSVRHANQHNHDQVHAHHAKAHNHSGDSPNQHHDYKHADGAHTHEHDHELALDHDHKHAHLHEHEHHHHHHDHDHLTDSHNHPEGTVRMLLAFDQPMVLPSFPDTPVGEVGVTLPLKPDPQIPGEMEPIIMPFPTSVSAQCPPVAGETLVDKLFTEDPLFKPAA